VREIKYPTAIEKNRPKNTSGIILANGLYEKTPSSTIDEFMLYLHEIYAVFLKRLGSAELFYFLFAGLCVIKYAVTCIDTAKNVNVANATIAVPNALSMTSLRLMQHIPKELLFMLRCPKHPWPSL
jgi:hypothetical protein